MFNLACSVQLFHAQFNLAKKNVILLSSLELEIGLMYVYILCFLLSIFYLLCLQIFVCMPLYQKSWLRIKLRTYVNVCGAIISLMIELHEIAFFHITWDTCFAMMYDFPWCCFWPFSTNTNDFTIICFQFFCTFDIINYLFACLQIIPII